jgi:hypothetical protein
MISINSLTLQPFRPKAQALVFLGTISILLHPFHHIDSLYIPYVTMRCAQSPSSSPTQEIQQQSSVLSPSKRVGSRIDRTLPVFSDFSHMVAAEELGTVKFAVGLREDNADAIMARVLPLAKYEPGEVKEKKPKNIKPKMVIEDKICSRGDCAARKDKLLAMKDENKSLNLKVRALEGRVETLRNKVALNKKSIILAEEKNDTLSGQIEESQTKIQTMTVDVAKIEGFNDVLRKQLISLQETIENIRAQTEDQTNQLQDLLHDKTTPKIIFSRDPRHRNVDLALEVSTLHFTKDIDEDSD